MNFRIEEALLYPYRHWITCMLIPGLVVYIDIIFMVILIIFVAILLAVLFPAFLSSVSHVNPAALLHWPSPQELVQALGQFDPGDLLRTEEGEGYGSGGGGGSGSGGIGQQWNGPLYLIFWMGFQWHLFARWQRQGYNAEPPAFDSNLGKWLLDGLKGGAFYTPLNIVLFLPLVIVFAIGSGMLMPFIQQGGPPDGGTLISFALLILGTLLVYLVLGFFLSPYLIAPMVHTAQNPTIKGLYDIRKAIEITTPRYKEILLSFLLIFALWWVYFLGTLVLTLVTCCVGILLFPFIWEGAFRVSAAHLIAQGFDYQPDASTQQPPASGGPVSPDTTPEGV